MDFMVKLFKTVGNNTRIKMLEILLGRSRLTADAFAETLKIPRATACRNLKILERMDFVKGQRNHIEVFYSLNRDRRLSYNETIIELVRKRHAQT